MTEKVKLPKNVCETLDRMRTRYSNEYIIRKVCDGDSYSVGSLLAEQNVEAMMKALVIGYEAELSAEEQIKEKHENPTLFIDDCNDTVDSAYRQGIEDALRIHGIKYDWFDWLDGDAE